MTAMQLKCWCVAIALVTWQASGQAPRDADPDCFEGMNAGFHQFPSNWEILMDTYQYRSLFGSSGPWEHADFDGSNSGVRGYNISSQVSRKQNNQLLPAGFLLRWHGGRGCSTHCLAHVQVVVFSEYWQILCFCICYPVCLINSKSWSLM